MATAKKTKPVEVAGELEPMLTRLKLTANAVCELLENTVPKVDPNHIAAVRLNVAGLRIRPDELGAVATIPYAQWAVNYTDASAASAAVLTCLNTRCPLLPAGGMLH